MEDGGWNTRRVMERLPVRRTQFQSASGLAQSKTWRRLAGGAGFPTCRIADFQIGGASNQSQRRRVLKPATRQTGKSALRRSFAALFCFCLLLSVSCLRASGQSYSIDWYKIGGGGGTSTNGQYSVTGTIGQHDAGGAMSGGNYSLTGGFWALISVVQTAGAPTLLISHSGNTVTVYWQDVSGWSLQQNNNLSLPGNWSASGGVTYLNGTNYLNVVSPAGNLFFRLQHP